MFKRSLFAGALALVLMLPSIPAGAQGDRRSAAEAYARVVDYRLLIEKTATQEPPSCRRQREAFIEFVTEEVDFDMTRFYAISAMVDLFEASDCRRSRPLPRRPKAVRPLPSCLPSARS